MCIVLQQMKQSDFTFSFLAYVKTIVSTVLTRPDLYVELFTVLIQFIHVQHFAHEFFHTFTIKQLSFNICKLQFVVDSGVFPGLF